jgi:acyl dehydratase
MAPPSFASIRVGDAPKPLTLGPLTRTDFVRYAGASLDLNPNHHDEVYAQRNGNKTVFGMGMLAGAYCGRLLTDWFGDGALTRLRIRFVTRFWPDDVLTITATVTGKREDNGRQLVDCEFTCQNQAGEAVIKGDATAALR